jgi:hypothetical protein
MPLEEACFQKHRPRNASSDACNEWVSPARTSEGLADCQATGCHRCRFRRIETGSGCQLSEVESFHKSKFKNSMEEKRNRIILFEFFAVMQEGIISSELN